MTSMLCVTFEKAELIGILANVIFLSVGGYLLYLVIRALKKYIGQK
ncbi:hypothetical protein DYBT9275_05283 [Dyadobacter sp. CECT 9275]|uniref:Uncharacterized protein n=1 Tax=Dyadobacter helix TaxID=2822344 RepID=A0A916NEA6_9BACT|nr:hypothetical protein DYBT9275_05283 [Dyadobacter sp. CECT 9275]